MGQLAALLICNIAGLNYFLNNIIHMVTIKRKLEAVLVYLTLWSHYLLYLLVEIDEMYVIDLDSNLVQYKVFYEQVYVILQRKHSNP